MLVIISHLYATKQGPYERLDTFITMFQKVWSTIKGTIEEKHATLMFMANNIPSLKKEVIDYMDPTIYKYNLQVAL